eukprot:624967-Prymnesium_polylepis.1
MQQQMQMQMQRALLQITTPADGASPTAAAAAPQEPSHEHGAQYEAQRIADCLSAVCQNTAFSAAVAERAADGEGARSEAQRIADCLNF